ncbi:helix-turn-helix domain-containing protein [Chamaesiphon polymorphus]|uniref:Transcriptional regulator n=1 Tax=Chamaesiphon polymorphus CCALA 037 TaxID=2107692 RepID=A0A2T1GJH4_9CYAN|nr:helix-turn-helix transcriptional regulator [Chamaesiphon polymorphus]PSB57959.1 transcriptional regulator [Chamaesiphon polymorphus CCALA 037]
MPIDKNNRDLDGQVTHSSGNVFADLGFDNPEQMLLKAELVRQISAAIKENGWEKERAANALGMEISKFSDLLRGRFIDYSIEQLFNYLNALDRDLEIIVKQSSGAKSRVKVTRV